MKRRFLWKLGLFLLAGAIINVAVAWLGQTLLVRARMWDWMPGEEAQQWWDKFARADWPAHPGPSMELKTWSCELVQVTSREAPLFGCNWESSGWPCRSVEGGAIHRNNQSESRWRWLLGHEQNYQLSLRPIWPGFAINTLFYAAILYSLCALPGAVRRRVRIKRGQCASCGYSLRDSVSDKCPECGAIK